MKKHISLLSVVAAVGLSSSFCNGAEDIRCTTYKCFEELEKRNHGKSYTAYKLGEDNYQIVFDTEKTEQKIVAMPVKSLEVKATTSPNQPIKKRKLITNEEKTKVVQTYTKALNLYKQKQYELAYKDFNALFEQSLNDANVNFYLGRSAFELKKYNEAVLAFERVLFENPDASRVKFEIAKTFMMLKQFKDAKKYFDEIKNDEKLPEAVKKQVEVYLAIIDKNTQKSFLNGVLLVGINYDSNIDSVSDDSVLPFNPADKVSDWAHQEVLLLNHKYILSETQTIKNDFMGFAKTMRHSINSSKDIKLLSYSPALSVNYRNGLTIDYGLYGDSLWINDENTLRTYALVPKFTYTKNKNLIYDGYLKQQYKHNQKSADVLKDTHLSELNLGLKYIINPNFNFGWSLTSAFERKDKGSDTTLSKDSHQVKFTSSYLLNKNFSIAPTVSFKATRYKDIDATFFKKIENDEYKLALSGTYIYSPQWIFQLNGDYTRQKSNVLDKEYDKQTYTFNIIRPF
ncbi:MAG: tetratricopeptide repeat protein [Campylobacterales bacterium]|nr:tetratricopeptide repeat protein [Campylobacterales bacterium]